MIGMIWQEQVDALGRGGYVRYDESTATRLGDMARQVIEEYGGDLRRMAERASGDTGRLRGLLQEFPGIGPTGAGIFCREAQAVWPRLAPYLDDVTVEGRAETRLARFRGPALRPG